MDINNTLINRLAGLAKLNFLEEEKKQIEKDLQNITAFFEKINELDAELVDIEPLVYINDCENIARKDEPKTLMTQAEGLKNAPLHDQQYIKVAKVIQNPNN